MILIQDSIRSFSWRTVIELSATPCTCGLVPRDLSIDADKKKHTYNGVRSRWSLAGVLDRDDQARCWASSITVTKWQSELSDSNAANRRTHTHSLSFPLLGHVDGC